MKNEANLSQSYWSMKSGFTKASPIVIFNDIWDRCNGFKGYKKRKRKTKTWF